METRKALRTSEIHGWAEKVQKHRERTKVQASFSNKTFSELSLSDKEELLKQVAERLGLIKAE
jgi:hypothetical protein